jgi:hypothetical protein
MVALKPLAAAFAAPTARYLKISLKKSFIACHERWSASSL